MAIPCQRAALACGTDSAAIVDTAYASAVDVGPVGAGGTGAVTKGSLAAVAGAAMVSRVPTVSAIPDVSKSRGQEWAFHALL